MPAVDRNVLRLAVFEVLYVDDVPDAVAVSEALHLVRDLSTDESPGFVNGVLGNIVRDRETPDRLRGCAGERPGVRGTPRAPPTACPTGWSARAPSSPTCGTGALRGADKEPWTGSSAVDREAVESEIAGPASWTRRQAGRPRPRRRDPRLGGRARPGGRPHHAARVRRPHRRRARGSTGSPRRCTPGSRPRPPRSAACARSPRPGSTPARTPRTWCSASGWPRPATPTAVPGCR